MTPEERILWRALRNDALANLHFRRQQVISGYIVDFYCASAKLAIELDGAAHLARKDYDAERDRALSDLGIRTIRLQNKSVVEDLAAVLKKISKEALNLTP